MSSRPPAGWYADPQRPGARRYWDGRQWTEHRLPLAGPATNTATPGARHRMGLPGRILMVLATLLGTATVGTLAVALAVGPAASPASRASSGGVATSAPPASAPRGSAASSTSGQPASGPGASPSTTSQAPTRPAGTPTASRTTAAKKAAVAAALMAVRSIVDGDTIKVNVHGTIERVRVIGIDTPELASHDCYAQQAASRMQSLVQSKRVRLAADPTQSNRDRYGRLLRHVYLADGRSVAQILIAGGYGREYTYDRAYAGRTAYLRAQARARDSRLGIWSSGCAAAAAPVATPKPATTPKPANTGACLIKGNISSSGERIYHVPGGAYYDVTRIDPAKGERWFCTESQAVAAGWRASKR